MISSLNIRAAGPGDQRAIERLALLDDSRRPRGELLLAEAGDELVAALPVRGGRAVADPFRPTAKAIELLALRARQLRPH
jgi:hypothetical protein